MEKFGVNDARARFSELIKKAEFGRSTVITKRGRVVAKIVPAKEQSWDRSPVLDDAEARRKSLRITRRFKLAQAIAEGRM